MIWFVGLIVAGVFHKIFQKGPVIQNMVWGLALGVVTSYYSHLVDGLFLVPLALLVLHRLSRKWDLLNVALVGFVVNSTLTYVLQNDLFNHLSNWEQMGWCTFVYVGICISMLLINTQAGRPIFYRELTSS